MFVSDKKNYVFVEPKSVKVNMKGSKWRGMDKERIFMEFVLTYLKIYATQEKDAANAYAEKVRQEIATVEGWDWVAITRKVGRGNADKFLKRAEFKKANR